MKTFVGIDLGSTTTKAVLLDEDRKVVGHGITNSRSNYATAARVASQEARVDGQFTLFRRALTEAHAQVELDTFLGALERAFRLEQFLEQLDDLEQTCVGQIQGERFAKVASGVKTRLPKSSSGCARRRPNFTHRVPSENPIFSAILLDRATTPTPRKSRAPLACPMTCCSTSMTSRSSRSKIDRRQAN